MRTTTVFLDRDGVINRESSAFVKNWSEFSFLPRSLDAFRLFRKAGMNVIVTTNQSAIARRLTTKALVEEIHANLKNSVRAAGGEIAAIYYCPHGPDDACDCRKPKPGMILHACRDHDIHPSESVLVGDSPRDIQSALSAGCRTVLVRTGNGATSEGLLTKAGIRCDSVVEDLYAAALWITGSGR